MKKIEAIIRPFKLEDVKAALAELGLDGMTVSEVRCYARHAGPLENYRGSEYQVGFLPKIKVEVVVPESLTERAAAAIVRAARTGKTGDGKIFIGPIDDALRIRTADRGEKAV